MRVAHLAAVGADLLLAAALAAGLGDVEEKPTGGRAGQIVLLLRVDAQGHVTQDQRRRLVVVDVERDRGQLLVIAVGVDQREEGDPAALFVAVAVDPPARRRQLAAGAVDVRLAEVSVDKYPFIETTKRGRSRIGRKKGR